MSEKPFDLRTFATAIKMAMTSEGMTGGVRIDVGEAGTLDVWVGQKSPDDYQVTVTIEKFDPKKHD